MNQLTAATRPNVMLLPLCASYLALLIITYLVVRRRWFHPLSGFPGPWYLAISEVPTAVLILSGRQYVYYKKLHDKYGPVVRVGPNELSFTGANAVDDIYGTRQGSSPMEKDPRWGLSGIYTKPYALQWAPREDHQRQRKALGQLFTSSALLVREGFIHSYIQQMVDIFSGMTDSQDEVLIDGQRWFGSLAFDIISSLCLGETFGCLQSADGGDWLHSVIKAFATGGYTQAASRIVGYGNWAHRLLARLITPKELISIRTEAQARAQATIMKRLGNPESDHDDFVRHILRTNDVKGHLSHGEIVMNLLSMLAAGGETSGAALTQWAFAIGYNTDAYHKLVNEIRGSFQSPGEITWNTVKDLPWLNATIYESFRWQGSVGQKIRIVPKSGALIDGHWVAGGTTVAISPFAANHSEANFSEPYSFKPERWLENDSKDKLHASTPFSHGPRNCIGKNLAMMELRLTIAYLLWHFDLEIERVDGRNWQWNPKNDFSNLRALATWQLPPLWIKLRKASIL